jgi:RHS repeat-associated protein
MSKGAINAQYTYNYQGERVAKSVNGVKQYFIYSPDGKLIAEADESGVVTKEYVYLQQTPLALMTQEDVYYYHNSHLDTPMSLTNDQQEIVWQAKYDAFGKATLNSHDIESNLRFPGQYFDEESGLHYNYFRDYDPELGRYIQSDPIGLAGGMNTYAYVGGNPISRVDPLGLASFKFDAYVGIGGGITIGYNPDTGNWFYGGRVGIGMGGGANLDVNDKGPEALARTKSPYGQTCPSAEAGNNGTRAGGFGALGLSLGKYGASYGGQGGRFFDGTGDSYSQSPGFNPSFNALGGNGISFGGAAGFEVIGWGG